MNPMASGCRSHAAPRETSGEQVERTCRAIHSGVNPAPGPSDFRG